MDTNTKDTPRKADQLIEVVRNLARQYPRALYCRPDEKSRACSYVAGKVQDGPPDEGCIFGQAFKILKWDLAQAQLHSKPGQPTDMTIGIAEALSYLQVSITIEQRDWCICVQTEQDTGSVWSDAVYIADLTRKIEKNDASS